MKHLILYTFTLLAVLITACKKDQYTLYNDISRLQFGGPSDHPYDNQRAMADSVKPFTFYNEPATTLRDTVLFDIYTIGDTTGKDRPFALEQVILDGEDNAVPDVHYKSFSDPSLKDVYVIKAGTAHALVPVILLRDISLKNRNVKLQFQIKANDQFQPGEKKFSWRRVEFTDMLNRPAAWDANGERYCWGKYSRVKHAFMIAQTNQRWDQDFLMSIYPDYSALQYWNRQLKTLLINYNNSQPGEPLTDETGEVVTFP